MDNSNIHILLVDDEAAVLDFMSYNLAKEGYNIHTASNGHEALESAIKNNPNLIVLDVMMPEMDGIETCRELRKMVQFKDTIITFLTARNEDYSQIAGFEAGADDYITKPIQPRLLVSKIQSLLRRVQDENREGKISSGDIELDRSQYLVFKNGEELFFPKKEFELLALLISKPGRVFMRDEIMSKVWGHETIVGDRTIDVHIRKLREKLGQEHIKTIKGVGYKFEE